MKEAVSGGRSFSILALTAIVAGPPLGRVRVPARERRPGAPGMRGKVHVLYLPGRAESLIAGPIAALFRQDERPAERRLIAEAARFDRGKREEFEAGGRRLPGGSEQLFAGAEGDASPDRDQVGSRDRRQIAQALAEIPPDLGPLGLRKLRCGLSVEPPDPVSRDQLLEAAFGAAFAADALPRSLPGHALVGDLRVLPGGASEDAPVDDEAPAHSRADREIKKPPGEALPRLPFPEGRHVRIDVDMERAPEFPLHERLERDVPPFRLVKRGDHAGLPVQGPADRGADRLDLVAPGAFAGELPEELEALRERTGGRGPERAQGRAVGSRRGGQDLRSADVERHSHVHGRLLRRPPVVAPETRGGHAMLIAYRYFLIRKGALRRPGPRR